MGMKKELLIKVKSQGRLQLSANNALATKTSRSNYL